MILLFIFVDNVNIFIKVFTLIILLLIIILLGYFYFKSINKRQLIKNNKLFPMQIEPKNATDIIPEKSEIQNLNHPPLSSNIYFNASIFVASGPRKNKNLDVELGEDACGIYNTSYGVYFWVLDGTSDSSIVESSGIDVFSSRLLSQLLSYNIYKTLNKISETIGLSSDLKEVLINSIEETKSNIQNGLNSNSESLLNEVKNYLHHNSSLIISSTLLLGFINNSGVLSYFTLGDSSIFSYKKDLERYSFLGENTPKTPRKLFMTIVLENDSIVIKRNEFENHLSGLILLEGVDFIVACSDGIGQSADKLKSDPKDTLSKIGFVGQKTFDDTSLIIIERFNR